MVKILFVSKLNGVRRWVGRIRDELSVREISGYMGVTVEQANEIMNNRIA